MILKETLWIDNINCVKVVAVVCVNIIMVVILVSDGEEWERYLCVDLAPLP